MAYTVKLRGGFSGFWYNERQEISLVEVYERIGKSVISVSKKVQKGQQMHCNSMAVIKSGKGSGFVICSYLKDSALTAIKLYKGKQGSSKGIQKGYPFCQKCHCGWQEEPATLIFRLLLRMRRMYIGSIRLDFH